MVTAPFQQDDFDALVVLGQQLWPESSPNDYKKVVDAADQAVFMGRDNQGRPQAFVIVALRYDYVEGTTSSPVGYIEGIYVAPEFRTQGVGRELLVAAEDWARAQGCVEVGSDTELENLGSQRFHMQSGFREVNRIVSFVKRIQ